MSIAEVAQELGVSPSTVLRKVRSGAIPGGERMWKFDGRKGERWTVLRAAFAGWRAANGANGGNAADGANLRTD
jgi:excisionase family DNA binding protein